MAVNGPTLDLEEDEEMETGSSIAEQASFFVRALYDFDASDASSLSFRKGALIEVLTQLDSGWWDGLLSNDVRGWFPSNYVERISDQEAEAALQAEEELATPSKPTGTGHDVEIVANGGQDASLIGIANGSSAMADSQYAGLGLGRDFDNLRKLMDGISMMPNEDGLVGGGGGDAFEQLAHASLHGSTTRERKEVVGTGSSARLRADSDARRSSRMSEQGSQMGSSLTANSLNFSQTDVSSAPTRSAVGSMTDADGSRNAAHLAAEAARNESLARSGNGLLRDSMEKERGRAHTVSVTGSQHGSESPSLTVLAGRPRAQTADAGASNSQSTTVDAGSYDPGSGSTAHKPDSRDNDSFWVPKVNARGEIFYMNTRTGERAHDIPAEAALASGIADDDLLLDSDEDEEEEHLHDSGARTPAARAKAGAGVQRNSEVIAADSNPALESRPSTASSSVYNAATKAASRGNPIDCMPDSRDVPWPWVARASEDGRTFYFYNRQTHEIVADLEEVQLAAGAGQIRNRASDGTINNRAQSRGRRQGSTGRRTTAAADDRAGPRFADERDALGLQQSMSEETYKPLRSLINEAGDAIAVLAAMASESIGSDGLSEADVNSLNPYTSSLHDTSRLSAAMANVVRTVRDLLHASGVLSIAAVDMASAAQTVERSLMTTDVPASSEEAVTAFRQTVSALQALDGQERSESSNGYVAYAGLSAVATAPQSLLPLGKKINATLSKLVLSSRSVVEQSCLNVEARPTFTEAQLERILSYRQRIRDDSIELARALGSFKNEATRTPIDPATGVPSWMRRSSAQVSSAPGVAGIGRNLFGGGAAAGWRGHGFVLPTATEAAALRAEAKGSYNNPFELTREARDALSSGRISLRRKPTQSLTRSLLDETVAPRCTLLNESLAALIRLASSNDAKDVAEDVHQLTGFICAQFGALLTILEETDLATSIDVDGPHSDAKRGSGQMDEYTRNVLRACELVHTFVLAKQTAQDNCNLLLLDAQDVLDTSALIGRASAEDGLLHGLQSIGERLLGVSAQLQSTLISLVDVMELQAAAGAPTLGARAKVYGAENIRLERGTATESRSTDDVIYLGPGLAIPNGPPSTSATPIQPVASAASSMTEVKSAGATTAPSSIKSLFQRSRSSTNPTNATPSAALVEAHSAMAKAGGGSGQDQSDSSFASRFGGGGGGGKMRRDTLDGALSAATSVHDGASADGGDAASAMSVRQVDEVPWFLQPDSPPNDIILAPSGQCKGATLPALMERLTMHNAFDSSFNNTFLTTYQSFTSTDELLDLLFARFRIEEPHGLTDEEHEIWVEKKQRPIRFRVFNVIKTWLESHYSEGEHEGHMQRIKDFATGEMVHSPAMTTPANLLLRIIERRSGTGEQMKITMVMPASAPPPILPKNFRKIKFLDIDPLEMARQLTLMDSRLYNRIRPAECLNKAWSRENGAEIARGVRDVISANNRVSGWVSEAILVQEDVKKRAAWVKQFVAIADRCYSLNNFSSMMAIYSGLNNASLNRLRRTWDAVNQRHLQLFDNMRAMLAPTRNFTKYRETLRKLNPPCVPFLGVYLTDLTFIEDGNADRLRTDERLINFSKRQMTAEKIQEIMIYQSTPYNLTPVPGIQKFIEENLIEARSDDELFEQSLRLEPREREDEKIARLLQESGFL